MIEKVCGCGKKFILDVPDGKGLAAIVQEWAAGLSRCDECIDKMRVEEQQKELEAIKERLLRDSQIPAAYREWDEAKGNGDLLAWMRKNVKESWYISGVYGSGKTRACCKAALGMISRGRSVKFWFVPDLCREISVAYTLHKPLTAIEDAIETEILILDDLGKERVTERISEALLAIIDARHRQEKTTWVTTNVKGSMIAERLGDHGHAIMRRLKEVCKEYG